MTRCSNGKAILALGGALSMGLACASPTPVPHGRLVSPRELAPAALPDNLEIAAGRVAALVLADRPDSAVSVLEHMRREEAQRQGRGEPQTRQIIKHYGAWAGPAPASKRPACESPGRGGRR